MRKKISPGRFRGFGRAEGDRAVDSFGSARHPGPLSAIKRQFLSIHREKVLPKKDAKVLEDIPQSADHWVVFANGLGGLGHINDVQHGNGE